MQWQGRRVYGSSPGVTLRGSSSHGFALHTYRFGNVAPHTLRVVAAQSGALVDIDALVVNSQRTYISACAAQSPGGEASEPQVEGVIGIHGTKFVPSQRN